MVGRASKERGTGNGYICCSDDKCMNESNARDNFVGCIHGFVEFEETWRIESGAVFGNKRPTHPILYWFLQVLITSSLKVAFNL